MSIQKIDLNNQKSVYGTLARKKLLDGEKEMVYQASPYSKFVNLYFNFTNISSNDIKVTVWGHAQYNETDDDIIEYEILIKKGMTYARGPIAISSKEYITVKTEGGDCVVRLYGFDERGS